MSDVVSNMPAGTPTQQDLVDWLVPLYGDGPAHECVEAAQDAARRHGLPRRVSLAVDASLNLMITYPDIVQRPGEAPLATLRQFVADHLADAVSAIHILPFYPASSDGGFSVMDYRAVDTDYGQWADIKALSNDKPLMFDLILNHASRRGVWFAHYLANADPGRDYFIEMDPKTDLRSVTRPRSTPLLAEVATARGPRHLWATFSDDQIDLDFSNPQVLREFIDIIFEYIARGAALVRLDAVGFLWKEIGTSCIHLPQTHRVIKFLRALIDRYAPGALLITETNVPHAENISYLTDGDEAHVAYQFVLPPLIAHTLLGGDARRLSAWAASLPPLPAGCHFLNFTASHDGIGVRAVESILDTDELTTLVETTRARGGFISTRSMSDGSTQPYELNISYYDLLAAPETRDTPTHIDRFVVSQAIAMALAGIPALYFHSLVATHNDRGGVEATGLSRAINRRRYDAGELDRTLANDSAPATVLARLKHLLVVRARQPAFHPDAAQTVVDLGAGLFALQRKASRQTLLAIHNVTDQTIDIATHHLPKAANWHNVVTDTEIDGGRRMLRLAAYEVAWISD
ncbi:MAG: alpha-amylase [Xanthomonadales bacterium]|nr:alpha-amylase [Xanthomonadales bacterium]|tara:strand:- start:2556 stop:4280 length:1725 start_codon:yes stop_codon:yes gene_type:complete